MRPWRAGARQRRGFWPGLTTGLCWDKATCSLLQASSSDVYLVLMRYKEEKILSSPLLAQVRWYPGRVHDFLSLTMGYLRSPEAPLRRAASVFTGR